MRRESLQLEASLTIRTPVPPLCLRCDIWGRGSAGRVLIAAPLYERRYGGRCVGAQCSHFWTVASQDARENALIKIDV